MIPRHITIDQTAESVTVTARGFRVVRGIKGEGLSAEDHLLLALNEVLQRLYWQTSEINKLITEAEELLA